MESTVAAMMPVTTLARSIESALRERTDPERRAVTESYFPSELEILGISAAGIRAVIREHRDAWRTLAPAAVLELAGSLCTGGIHEARQAGYEIVEARRDAWSLLSAAVVEELGAGNDNWASVDTFATRVAGHAWREGFLPDSAIRGWCDSGDRWWRRTALVCTVALNVASRGGTGDAARTIDVCDRLASDTDPMVAKGLSWALRALSGRDPAAVRSFLARHGRSVPARVRREVANKLETGRKAG